MAGDVESDGDDSIITGTVCSEQSECNQGSNVLPSGPQVVIVDPAGFLVGPRETFGVKKPRCEKAGAVFTARTAMRINELLAGDSVVLAKARRDVWSHAVGVPGLGSAGPPATLECLFRDLVSVEEYLSRFSDEYSVPFTWLRHSSSSSGSAETQIASTVSLGTMIQVCLNLDMLGVSLCSQNELDAIGITETNTGEALR